MITRRSLLLLSSAVAGFALFSHETQAKPRPAEGTSPSSINGGPFIILPQDIGMQVNEFQKRMLKYGLPSHDNLRLYERFITAADFERRIPKWVLQINARDEPKNGAVNRQNSNFNSHSDHVPDAFRASNTDYMKSGWSRGHMVPASDCKASQNAMNETFILNSNIVPQHGQNNANFWLRLEVFCRDILPKHFENVYVISGPLFLPSFEAPTASPTGASPSSSDAPAAAGAASQPKSKKVMKYDLIGPNNVAVPTHLFKIILAEPKPDFQPHSSLPYSSSPSVLNLPTPLPASVSSSTEIASTPAIVPAEPPRESRPLLAAFVVPNTFIPPKAQLRDFEVPIEFVEKHTGLQFFRRLDRQKESRQLCNNFQCSVMTENELELYMLSRKIYSSRNTAEIEQAVKEVNSKGISWKDDETCKNAYNKKMAEFGGKK